jgi:FkbM family methyltransferase
VRGSAFFYRKFPRLVFTLRRIAGANKEREMALLDVLCDRKRTGIDIGAKVGMYTYRIRAQSSDVVAFEPIPLFNNMLAAVFNGKRGRIEPFAVSSTHAKVTMRLPYGHDDSREYGRSTIEPNNPLTSKVVARVEEIEVETRTIDSYTWSDVGFIKIDVEGHELSVLDGAVATLASHRPTMLIECNDEHHPEATARLATWLHAHDYDAVFMNGKQLCDIDGYVWAEHWSKHGIENFICVHRSCPEQRTRIGQRFDGGWPTVTKS